MKYEWGNMSESIMTEEEKRAALLQYAGMCGTTDIDKIQEYLWNVYPRMDDENDII